MDWLCVCICFVKKAKKTHSPEVTYLEISERQQEIAIFFWKRMGIQWKVMSKSKIS